MMKLDHSSSRYSTVRLNVVVVVFIILANSITIESYMIHDKSYITISEENLSKPSPHSAENDGNHHSIFGNVHKLVTSGSASERIVNHHDEQLNAGHNDASSGDEPHRRRPVIHAKVIRKPHNVHFPGHHTPELRNTSNNNFRGKRDQYTVSQVQYNKRLKNYKEPEPKALMLDVYKTESEDDAYSLNRWFCSTISEDIKGDAKSKLKKESCFSSHLHEAPGMYIDKAFTMCDAYRKVEAMYESGEKKVVFDLTEAECYSITMYTSEFYSTYNANTRKGFIDSYKVFTALLYSAVKKLDKSDPLGDKTLLYRGMKNRFDAPDSKRFYFKQFISATMDKEIAKVFGSDTFIQFVHKTPDIAAKIKNLSIYPVEEEILLVPFEAFEKVKTSKHANENLIELRTSDKQEVMNMKSGECKAKGKPKSSDSPIHQRHLKSTMEWSLAMFIVVLVALRNTSA